jgi:hypothetical protein
MGGSPRLTVLTGQALPELSWHDEQSSLTGAWPCLGPAWLAAAGNAMPHAQPWHSIAARAKGELALTPGYILATPPALDHDPRTYLGWQPAADRETIQVGQAVTAASAEIDDLGATPFFPALLLGSPLSYHTEVAYNFWTPALMQAIISALVPAAFAAGVRSIIAPWIPHRRGNAAITDALTASGGHCAFWGHQHFTRINPGGPDTRPATLPPGLTISRADGAGILPHIPRIAELACRHPAASRTGCQPSHVAGTLTALLDGGASISAYLGSKNGDPPIAACAAIRKNHRMYITWPATVRGTRNDADIASAAMLDVLVRDARAEGLQAVEYGSSASTVNPPAGTQARAVTTALVLSDPRLRQQAASWQDTYGRTRRASAGETPVP